MLPVCEETFITWRKSRVVLTVCFISTCLVDEVPKKLRVIGWRMKVSHVAGIGNFEYRVYGNVRWQR